MCEMFSKIGYIWGATKRVYDKYPPPGDFDIFKNDYYDDWKIRFQGSKGRDGRPSEPRPRGRGGMWHPAGHHPHWRRGAVDCVLEEAKVTARPQGSIPACYAPAHAPGRKSQRTIHMTMLRD